MVSDSTGYGGAGLALLRALGERGQLTFTVGDARDLLRDLGVAPTYVTGLLHRLARAGWVSRIKRGTYALGPALPGLAAPHPFAAAMALVQPCAVSGWAALNHHGLTEQIPQVITLTTTQRVVTPAMRGAVKADASTWQVGEQRFEIVTVVPAHFFGIEEVWVGESKVSIFDRERAVLDCFALPRRFGGLAEGLGILEEHRREIDVRRLVAHAELYGKASVARRVGWALEHFGQRGRLVERLAAFPMQGTRPLDPTRPPRGLVNRRWGLRENLAARGAR
jgi:predicted transcriptional regulator of viral defense system